jgi:hypothetical protein
MLGVSFTSTGVWATSLTQPVIMRGVLGHLPDGAAHAALAHTVGTAEIQFEPIRARVFGSVSRWSCQAVAIRLYHQRRNHGVMREALFDLRDLAQVYIQRAVGDQLDVVQSHHALAVPV